MNARSPVAERHPGGLDRNRDLKLIHIAKKQLNMADDAYRSIILAISNQRVRSAADLTGPERAALLKHLKSCGFRPVQPVPRNVFPDEPQWKLLWSLWQQLADAGLVRDRRGPALTTYVKHQAKVEAMAWVTPSQLHSLIEQLKQWLARA